MFDAVEVRRLWEETELTTRVIADQLGITKSALIGYANRRHWIKLLPPEKPWKEEARRLWNAGGLSARQISERLGVSKNAIVGMAARGNWAIRGISPTAATTTMRSRLDALAAKMDAVLAETAPVLARARARFRQKEAAEAAEKRARKEAARA